MGEDSGNDWDWNRRRGRGRGRGRNNRGTRRPPPRPGPRPPPRPAGGGAGKFLKVAGGPIAAMALAAYANKEELMETGAVDPLKQAQKTGEGLGKLFSLDDDLLSMNRLQGGLDAMTGAAGTVLGGISTGGKAVYKGLTGQDASNPVSEAVNQALGPGFAHGAIDSIVGLFGGETDADRAEKAKKIEEEALKRIKEQKIERERQAKAATVAAGVVATAGVTPDTAGSLTQPTQQVAESLKAKEQNQKSMELLADSETKKVQIEQPKEKPIPVTLTDDKGEPLVTSADRQAAVAAKNAVAPPGAAAVAAASPAGAVTPAAAPVVAQQLTQQTSTASGAEQRNPFATAAGTAAAAGVAGLTAAARKAGAGLNAIGVPEVMSAITHQQNAYTTSNFTGYGRDTPMTRSQQAAAVVDQANAQSQPAAVTPAITPKHEFVAAVPVDRMAALKDADVEQASRLHKAATQPLADYDTPLPDTVKQMRIKTNDGTKTAEELGITTFGELQSKGGQAFSGGYNDPATTFATALIQKEMGDNFNRVTAQNDQYHQKHSPKSGHTQGTKTDFTVKNMSYADAHTKTADIMAKHGLEEGKDFKIISKSHGTGDHIDFKLLPSGQAKMQNVMAKESTPSPTSVMASAAQAIPAMLGAQGVPGAATATSLISKGSKIDPGVMLQELKNVGITDPKAQANVLAQFQAESGFTPKSENMNYSPERLMQVFPKKFKNIDDAKEVAAGGPEAIGNRVYGNRMGNNADEGYKFRGRGIIQLTGKSNYADMDKKLGLNGELLKNPDLANDPNIAVKIASQYMSDRKGKFDYTDINQVGKAVGYAGGKHETNKRAEIAQKFAGQIESGSIKPVENNLTTTPNQLAPYDETAHALDVPVTEDMVKNMAPEQRNIVARGAGAIARGGLHVLTQGARDAGEFLNDIGVPEVMSAITHQQNAYTTSNFRGYRDRKTGERIPSSGRNQQPAMSSEVASRTFTGSVPPAAQIPPITPKPDYLKGEPNRVLENWDLMNHPNVKGTVDALSAAGVSIPGGHQSLSKAIPDTVRSGMSKVDALRENGVFRDMMDGNLSAVLARVAPNMPNVTGVQNAFDKGAAGLSSLKGGRALEGATDTFFDSLNMLPSFTDISDKLANMGFQEKSAERAADSKAVAEAIPPAQTSAGGSNANSGMGRGGNLLNKSDEPILVRNPESAIRELTKVVVGFSFG